MTTYEFDQENGITIATSSLKRLSKFFFGVSHCHPKDKFDAVKGAKIAKLRALLKIENYLIQKAVSKYKKQVHDLQAQHISYISKRNKCIEIYKQELKDLQND